MTSLDTTSSLTEQFRSVRNYTQQLASALTEEDQCVQSMSDASPAKWHRAHTTWFFEQFVLAAHLPGYERFDPDFGFLFNSYYETVGARQPRPARGLITRPGARGITDYRRYVDAAVIRLLEQHEAEIADLIAIGVVQNPVFLGYTGRAKTAGLRGPDFGGTGVLCGKRQASPDQARWG